MNDLYETLGVSPDATAEEIKAAHRKKSLKHHPDREGSDPEQFKLITLARDVLIDKDRRSKYDDTGNFDESPQVSVVESGIGSLVSQAFAQDKIDPIDWMRKHIKEQLSANRKTRGQGEVAKKNVTKKLVRFKSKTKETKNTKARGLIAMVMESQINQIAEAIAQADKAIECGEDMLAYLDGIECPVDEMNFTHEGTSYTFRAGGGDGGTGSNLWTPGGES